MKYQLENKEVFVFAAGSSNPGNYKWYAIILEEKRGENPTVVHFEECISQEKCEESCEKNFRKLYPAIKWKGFVR